MLTIKEPDWWKVGRAYWAIIGNLHTLTIYTGPRRATLCQNVLEEKEEKNFKKIVRSLASPWPDIGGISRHVIKRLTPSLDTQSPRCWFVRLKQDGATFDFIGRKIGALENGANSEMNDSSSRGLQARECPYGNRDLRRVGSQLYEHQHVLGGRLIEAFKRPIRHLRPHSVCN